MRSVFKNSIYNLFGQIIPLLVALAAMPITERAYGLERFSLLAIIWTFLGFFSFLDFGFGRATTRFIAEARGGAEPDRSSRIVRASIVLNALVGVAGMLVIAAAFPYAAERIFNIPDALKQEATVLVLVLSLCVPGITMASGLRGALEATERFDLVNAVKIPANSLLFLLPLLGAWFGWTLLTVVILIVASRFLTAALNLFFVGRNIPSVYRGFLVHGPTFTSLLRFGGWISVNNIVSALIGYGERFVILALLPGVWLSYYLSPAELVARMVVIPASVSLTLFPRFSQDPGPDAARIADRLILTPTKLLLLMMIPLTVFFVLCSYSILELWMNPEFARHGHMTLSVLAVAVFFNALGQIPFSALQGFGRPDLTAKIIAVESVLFLGGCWLAVGTFGIDGAAWMKLFALLGETAVLFLFTFTVLKIRAAAHLTPEFRRMLILTGGTLAAALVIKLLVTTPYLLLGAAVVLSAGALAAGWRGAVSDAEKRELLAMIRPARAGSAA